MERATEVVAGAGDDWAPTGIDLTKPSIARMYDYLLGGKDHFEIDREAVAKAEVKDPNMRRLVWENRWFLQRAVRYLAEHEGIRQFIDIGTGLPTQDNVHEIAQRVDPSARVVYVDNDPIVLAHGRALLATNTTTVVIQADLRDPEAILDHPDTSRLIDFNEPLAVLFVAILHCLSDEEDPDRVVARFRDAMVPGSFLVLSHATNETASESAAEVVSVYREHTSQGYLRDKARVSSLFDGFGLVDPGVVLVAQWRRERPVPDPEKYWVLGGVGKLR